MDGNEGVLEGRSTCYNKFMRLSHLGVAVPVFLVSVSTYFAVNHWMAVRQMAKDEADLEEFGEFVEKVEQRSLVGLLIPTASELLPNFQDNDRARALSLRYDEFAKQVNGAARLPELPLLNSALYAADMMLLKDFLDSNPAVRDEPDSYFSAVEARVEEVRRKEAKCPCVPFGTSAGRFGTAGDILTEIERARKSADPIVRFSFASNAISILAELESDLASARPMPVINGDARGALPMTGTLVRFCESEKPLPATQTFFSAKGNWGGNFELVTHQGDSHIYARLVGPTGDVWRAFVRAGASISVEVPKGDYTLRYATGTKWYGESYLFGPATTFAEAEGVMDIRSASKIQVKLIRQVGGNLSERSIDANRF